MIAHRPLRRSIALALVMTGGLLMLLAPPVWVGAIPLGLGVLLELIGITLERTNHTYRRPRYSTGMRY